MDEFGVNVWTSRSKGRAAVGQRAVRIVEGQRGQNLTICLAVSSQIGLVHHTLLNGGMTRELFGEFVTELSQLLMYNDESYVVLCDNATSHRNIPFFGEQGDVRYLPKYSPFLAGSVLKAAVKRRITEPAIQREIYNRAVPRNESLHSCRMRVLRREVENCLPVITARKCADFFNHMMGYMPACLRQEDIID